MANQDAPSGFKPLRHYMGGVIRAHAYSIASAYNTAIYTGSPVKPTGTNKNIAIAAAGDRLVGVFAGCQYVDASGDVQFRPYWAASTATLGSADATAWVYDDPHILFEIQADEDIVAADIGAMADHVGTSGSATTGQSTTEIDSSDIGTGTELRIIELIDRPDNAFGNFAKVGVMISKHYLAGAMTAI